MEMPPSSLEAVPAVIQKYPFANTRTIHRVFRSCVGYICISNDPAECRKRGQGFAVYIQIAQFIRCKRIKLFAHFKVAC